MWRARSEPIPAVAAPEPPRPPAPAGGHVSGGVRACLAATALALSACGGGGGSEPAPVQPDPPIAFRTVDASSSLSTALLDEPELVFTVLSDSHLFTPAPDAVYEQYNRNTELAVDQMGSLGPAFALHCGDAINTNPTSASYGQELLQASSFLQSFGFPVYLAPGNHDVGNKASILLPLALRTHPAAANYFVQPANLTRFRQAFGQDFFSFGQGSTRILVLNSQLFASGLPDEAEQWGLVERTADEVQPGESLVAVMHVPAYWDGPADPDRGNYEVVDGVSRQRLLDLLDGSSASEVTLVTGHTHAPICNVYGRVRLVTVPSVAFQRNFGFYDGEAAFPEIDQARLGYLVARTRGSQLALSREEVYPRLPPVPQLAGTPDEAPRRAVGRTAAEVADNLFLVQAALPSVHRQPWAPEGAIDETVPGAAAASAAWSSAPRLTPEGNEWIEVRFATAQEIDEVRLTPRPLTPTESGGFPEDFSISLLGEDGLWREGTAYQGYPAPRGASPQAMAIPRQFAGGVRVTATKLRQGILRPSDPVYCVQLSEISARLAGGPNVAAASAGATVRASSCGRGAPTRRSDREWLAALESGAKWVHVPHSVRWAAPAPGSTAGGSLTEDALFMDALATAGRWGVRVMVSLPAAAAPSASAYAEFCQLMASRFAARVDAWQLGAAPEDVASLPAGALAAAAGAVRSADPGAAAVLPLAADDLSPLTDPAVRAAADWVSVAVPPATGTQPAELLASYEEGLGAAIEAIRATGYSGRVAVANTAEHLARAGAEADQGALLAHLAVLHQEQGVVTTLPASGHPAGLLDAEGNPRYAYHALRALAAVLSDTTAAEAPLASAADPTLRLRSFSGAGGKAVVAFWTEGGSPARVSLHLETPGPPPAKAYLLDPVGMAIAPGAVSADVHVPAVATGYPRFLVTAP